MKPGNFYKKFKGWPIWIYRPLCFLLVHLPQRWKHKFGPKPPIKVVGMIPFDVAYELETYGGKNSIGGLGGFFGWEKPMRWKDYLNAYTKKGRPYCEAFKKYIVEHEIRECAPWHQNENNNGAPLFSDGTTATFSYRAWGDIMAAVWSEEEDKDYNYMDFYM